MSPYELRKNVPSSLKFMPNYWLPMYFMSIVSCCDGMPNFISYDFAKIGLVFHFPAFIEIGFGLETPFMLA